MSYSKMRHEQGKKDRIMTMTNEPYPWSSVTQTFCSKVVYLNLLEKLSFCFTI